MEIKRSSRHPKIIGNCGELIICNWLSRSGWEVTLIDHTGIDIIAYDPAKKRRIGITVKSRTRTNNTENTAVHLFNEKTHKDKDHKDIDKANAACEAFGCELWIAVYVESSDQGDIYLTSYKNYERKYRIDGKSFQDWNMGLRSRKQYESDPHVHHIEFKFKPKNWFTEWK